MGYTHSYTFQPGSDAYAMAWPVMVANARRIIDAVQAAGIVIVGPDGTDEPVTDPSRGISFNGDQAVGQSEGFYLPAPGLVAPGAPADCRRWMFVKTNRQPYDLAVTALLLRVRLLLPDSFAIGSDGAWDEEWAAADAGTDAIGPPSTRALIADLFGSCPHDSPLTDPSEGMAIGLAGWIDPRLVDNPIVP